MGEVPLYMEATLVYEAVSVVCVSAVFLGVGVNNTFSLALVSHRKCTPVPLSGLPGFRPPGNSLEVGAILAFETALKLIARCKLTVGGRVVLNRVNS
jgi:hypothetical protein